MSVGVLTSDYTKTYHAKVSTGGYVRAEMQSTDESDLFTPIHFSEIEIDGVVYADEYLTASALNKVIWVGSGATPPVPQIDVEKDIICKNNTWHYITTVYTDGVETSTNETDSGIPCDEPQPIEPKIEDVEVCDATTNTIHVIVNQYTYPDPTDLTNIVTTQLNDIETNIPCGASVQVDETHTLVSGTGNVPAGLKTVTINNMSGVTAINGGFELGDGRRDISISFNATELSEVRGLLPAYTLAGGTFQWIGLEPIIE